MKTGDLVMVLESHWRASLVGKVGVVVRTDPQRKNALVLLPHNGREAWFHVDSLELFEEKT